MTTNLQHKRTDKETRQLARMLSIAGDPTRLDILCFLFEELEACVSEIAEEVDISVASASYHLNKMADNDLLIRERDGNAICYCLAETSFIKKLEELICQSK